VGLAQVERLDKFLKIKTKIAGFYRQRLAGIRGLRFMPARPWAKSVYWVYAVELDPQLGLDATTVMGRLRQRGIATRPFFLGLHEQPVFRRLGLFGSEFFPHAEMASRLGFYLPSGLTLDEASVEKIAATLCDSLK
jgi:perosamine synthetase